MNMEGFHTANYSYHEIYTAYNLYCFMGGASSPGFHLITVTVNTCKVFSHRMQQVYAHVVARQPYITTL